MLGELKTTERVGEIARRLQPYVVQIHPGSSHASALPERSSRSRRSGSASSFGRSSASSLYRADLGLTWDDPTYRESRDEHHVTYQYTSRER